jgi:serine/threonine-protein kinase RsbW
MARSVRLYTPAQFEEVKALVDLLAGQSGLLTAERDRLTTFQADVKLTVSQDRRRAAGTARLSGVSSRPGVQTQHAPAAEHTSTYPGQADQVQHVRHAMAKYLTRCPAAADAVLVVSELASNAIVHSASRGAFFTIRAEVRADHIRIEAEDLGGPWRHKLRDDRPHGLDVVEALTGPTGWGIKNLSDRRRVVWARLDLPMGERVTYGTAGTFQTSTDGTPRP